MFHLNPGVHLDEKPLVGITIQKKFDGARVVVFDFSGNLNGSGAKVVADCFVEIDGGSNLDDLLVATLNGAVALMEVHDIALMVAHYLNLDMLGLAHKAFEEDGRVAKGVFSFGLRLIQKGVKVLFFFDDTHTPPATTESGLDDQGEPNIAGNSESLSAV